MDELVRGLGPAFAAGLAIQQLLELADPLLDQLGKTVKSYVTSIVALVLGFLLAGFGVLQVLGPLGADVPNWMEVLVTGLIISGGTEGINSILKFLGYAKESQKGDAKEKAASNPPTDVTPSNAAKAIDDMHV
jgi:hypothetical protein